MAARPVQPTLVVAATATPPTDETTSAPSAPTPAPHAMWREQLAPWLDELSRADIRIELPPLPTVFDMDELWIQVVPPEGDENTRPRWTSFIEALELLELLARVDNRAAWYLLFELTKQQQLVAQYSAFLLPTDSVVLPKFQLKISFEALVEDYTNQGLVRLIVKNTKTWTDGYATVKQTLLTKWSELHNGLEFDREIQGRVELSLDYDLGIRFEPELGVRVAFWQVCDIALAHAYPNTILERRGRYRPARAGALLNRQRAAGGRLDLATIHGDDDDDDAAAGDGDADDDHSDGGDDGGGDDGGAAASSAEATAHSSLRKRQARERGDFTIVSFRYDVALGTPHVTNLVLYLVNQVAEFGMRITHCTLARLFRNELHESTIRTFLLGQLEPWESATNEFQGLDKFRIDLTVMDAAAVRGVFTALVSSYTLREFHQARDVVSAKEPQMARGEMWWPWLAYALFSREASHEIESVTLSFNVDGDDQLTMARIQAIRKVLEHSDPMALLYQLTTANDSDTSDEEEQEQENGEMGLYNVMAVTLDSTARIHQGHYRLLPPDMEGVSYVRIQGGGGVYRVLRNQPEEPYIEFVLPSIGICWADRSAIDEVSPLVQRETHSIRHLTLRYLNDATVPPAVALLELIGGPIERLTIVELKQDSSDVSELFDGIERYCPSLQRLDLVGCHISSLNWFNSVQYPLDTLCLDSVTVANRMSWGSFFDVLCEQDHPLTRSLRQLHVGFRRQGMSDEARAAEDYAFFECIDILSHNRILRRCEWWSSQREIVDKYEAGMLIHNGEFIAEEDAPLPSVQKMAFLSVITPQRTTNNKQTKLSEGSATSQWTSARSKMNPEMAQLVMDFAAMPKRRVCGIQFKPTVELF